MNLFKTLLSLMFALNLSSCTTIQNRSKPPPIEHFNQSYEKVFDDLIQTNSFSFIYKSETYDFHPAMTYISQGPEYYYLGYKNGKLSYVVPEHNISGLKEIFGSKDLLYLKTQKIVEKLNEFNQFPAKSIPYDIHPGHSVLYDLTNDVLTFTIYGSLAVIAIPFVIHGYADYLWGKRFQNKLNSVRVGMSAADVHQLIPEHLEKKRIDAYDVELYTSRHAQWYTNALLIFEDGKLVGLIRSATTSPISDFYKKL